MTFSFKLHIDLDFSALSYDELNEFQADILKEKEKRLMIQIEAGEVPVPLFDALSNHKTTKAAAVIAYYESLRKSGLKLGLVEAQIAFNHFLELKEKSTKETL